MYDISVAGYSARAQDFNGKVLMTVGDQEKFRQVNLSECIIKVWSRERTLDVDELSSTIYYF